MLYVVFSTLNVDPFVYVDCKKKQKSIDQGKYVVRFVNAHNMNKSCAVCDIEF